MKMADFPAALIPATKSRHFFVSERESPMVGSSRMISSALKYRARVIATPCRSPPEKVFTVDSGVTAEEVNPMRLVMSCWVSRRIAFRSRRPHPVDSSLPMKMLRHSDCLSASARS